MPEKEKISTEVSEILDKYYRGVIGVTEFESRMREEGYTRAEAYPLLGKYERGEVTIVPKPEYQYVGDDAVTGNDIFYDPEKDNYVLVHPRTKREIRRSPRLEIDYTISIETRRGHSVPFVSETVGRTMVRKKSRNEISEVEDDLQTSLESYFRDQPGFDQIKSRAQKKALEYRFGEKAPRWTESEVYIEKSEPREYRYPESGYRRVNLEDYM